HDALEAEAHVGLGLVRRVGGAGVAGLEVAVEVAAAVVAGVAVAQELLVGLVDRGGDRALRVGLEGAGRADGLDVAGVRDAALGGRAGGGVRDGDGVRAAVLLAPDDAVAAAVAVLLGHVLAVLAALLGAEGGLVQGAAGLVERAGVGERLDDAGGVVRDARVVEVVRGGRAGGLHAHEVLDDAARVGHVAVAEGGHDAHLAAVVAGDQGAAGGHGRRVQVAPDLDAGVRDEAVVVGVGHELGGVRAADARGRDGDQLGDPAAVVVDGARVRGVVRGDGADVRVDREAGRGAGLGAVLDERAAGEADVAVLVAVRPDAQDGAPGALAHGADAALEDRRVGGDAAVGAFRVVHVEVDLGGGGARGVRPHEAVADVVARVGLGAAD